jgi:isoamylase
MLTMGDEIARSQMGNNNTYCQDSELSWMDWNLDDRRKRLREFTCKIIRLRLEHPNLHRRKFFQDREIRRRRDGTLVLVEKDADWFNANGKEVSDEEWNAGWTRAIALLLNGCTLQITDENGEGVVDDSFLLLINAADQGVEFTLPSSPRGKPWRQILNTENIDDPFAERDIEPTMIVGGRALKLLSDGAAEA